MPNTYTDHAPTSEAIGYVNAIHVMSPNNTAIELVTHSLSNFSVQKSCDIRIKTFNIIAHTKPLLVQNNTYDSFI